MNRWIGDLLNAEDWITNGLSVIYALICISLLVCHLCAGPRAWMRARLPVRWIPTSHNDPMHSAWFDLLLSAGGLSAIAWLTDASVDALGMLAITLLAGLVLRVQ